MTRILLTGGNGFFASHVLEILLIRGHSVVTTVRSAAKVQLIKDAHPHVPKDKLDFVIVEDIAQENAFDHAVVSDPPFEAVIHTASPFHFRAKSAQEMLEPAVRGTISILQAVQDKAPTVKRVIITSSAAAVLDPAKFSGKTYSEVDWNPQTMSQAGEDVTSMYRASKTFAEKAAWEFVELQKPSFTLVTCNPPLMFGPILHLQSSINTSNQRVLDLITGKAQNFCPPTGVFLWVDVRDAALAHVLAVETEEAGGKRFFLPAGKFCNKELAIIIGEEFPELKDKLPAGDALKSGDFPPGGIYGFDNSRSRTLLGITYRSFRESVVDTVKSLKAAYLA